jgi:hypothetical protein
MKVKYVGDGWELKPENDKDKKMILDLYNLHRPIHYDGHKLGNTQKLVISTKNIKDRIYHLIWTYG